MVEITRTHHRLLYACYLAYGLVGLVMGMRTPLFYYVQTEYLDGFSHLGTLVLVSGIAMQGTLYLSGVLIDRIGYISVLKIGMAAFAVPLFLMSVLPGIAGFDLAYILLMLGYGIAVLVLNLFVSALVPERKGNVLMMLHLYFALGALMGPKLMSWTVEQGYSWRLVVGVTAAFFMILSFGILFIKGDAFVHTAPTGSPGEHNTQQSRGLIVLFVVMFICSQTWEYGIGTWFTIFGDASKGLTADESAVYLTVFYGMYPVMRIVFAKLIHKLPLVLVLLFAFAGTSFFVLLGIASGQMIFYSFTGIGVSLMYPAMMALMQQTLGTGSTKLIGKITMMGGLIQYVAIWAVGIISDKQGMVAGFNSMVVYTLAGTVAVAGIWYLTSGKGNRRRNSESIENEA